MHYSAKAINEPLIATHVKQLGALILVIDAYPH